MLLSPVIQPWYLLWAALPLAASTGLSRYRRATVWLTTAFSVIIMPNGATIPVFTIVQGVVVAAAVVGGVLMLLRRSGLPPARSDPRRLLHPVTSVPKEQPDAVIAIPTDAADTTQNAADPYPRKA